MDKEEYERQMAEIEEQQQKKTEEESQPEIIEEYNETPNGVIPDGVIPDDELEKIIKETEGYDVEAEVEKREKILREEREEVEKEADKLRKMPSLREFMKTEEFLRLGTKAKVPVAIDLNGYPVKVFVRALSRNEIQACRIQAQNTDDDMDFLAVLKACTDEYGEPFDRETLDQLGYARIRDISEAIGIASGESPENTESAIRKQVIDNFLQKIEDET